MAEELNAAADVMPAAARAMLAARDGSRPRPPRGGYPSARDGLPFRAVNRRDCPAFDPGLQRHHLLPRQLLSQRCFARLFHAIGSDRIGFDDFRSNGLLLPASDAAAIRLGLPLHRGPHRGYNHMVIDRVGQVERSWANARLRAPEQARGEALMRLGLLQRALRRRLLDHRRRMSLNRFDPLARQIDFAELDALVDALWPEADGDQAVAAPSFAASSAFAT